MKGRGQVRAVLLTALITILLFSCAADKLKTGRTKLLFVNQYSNGCEILRPVFNLTGTAENKGGSVEFAARIIAIPERYTHE